MNKEQLEQFEADNSAPLTWAERVMMILACLALPLGAIIIALICAGCLSNKASHQNGIVLYVSTSGQLGVGYGETEDLPAGCVFRREVVQTSPAFWSGGTNYTRTVTEWDTTGMCATNAATAAGKAE